MARIKKQGLDYFPMNTDFIHNRLVRRVMKHEGDAALAVLLEVFSCIYAGEGYYVCADKDFYEDLADNLFEKEAEDVQRIVTLAVEYGLFDATLFQEYSVLTTADIQRQFLFITKRRNASLIEARYCLLAPEELTGLQDKKTGSSRKKSEKTAEAERALFEDENAAFIPENATITPENNVFLPENSPKTDIGTQSIEKHSKEKQSIIPPSSGSPTGGTRGSEGEEEATSSKAPQRAAPSRKEWTDEEITRLQPPPDGASRNLEGLIYNLRSFRIPPTEQYAIICKSNYGIIGHPMWKGFCTLRESHGKIRQPGRYLLSLCK